MADGGFVQIVYMCVYIVYILINIHDTTQFDMILTFYLTRIRPWI